MILSKRRLPPGQRVRAIVIGDSALRQLVVRALEQDQDIEVLASAPDTPAVVERIARLQPDIVVLVFEPPDTRGFETLRKIRANFPNVRVVVSSSQTDGAAARKFEALSLGADDYVANAGSAEAAADFAAPLVSKIKRFFAFPAESSAAPPPPPAKEIPPVRPLPNPRCSLERPKAILIGVSTGGPEALAAVVPQVPANFQLPILIVQHMPPLFTGFLCDRLRDGSKLPVREARHGETLDGPRILLAPGDFHMRLAPPSSGNLPVILLDRGPLENSCRPAVDALFCSAAQIFGGAVLAIVMTGMGQDGLRGAATLKSVGAFVICQDEGSSAVWGMPRAVAEAGLADLVVPLERIVPAMLNRVALLSRAEDSQPKHNSIDLVKS